MRCCIIMFWLSLAPYAVQAFTMAMPVECEFGTYCMIQQYTDLDEGPGALDYRCGTLSYDGHKGTDFRLRNLADMRKGVNVLATADGMVRGLRDGMEDINLRAMSAAAIEGKECGNGVVLTHEGGWETQYCHLKKASVRVKKGQVVKAGDVLGQIGLSGSTEFPHLHLSVRKNGKVVDPFIGLQKEVQCNPPNPTSLWDTNAQAALSYKAGGLIDMSFSNTVPTYDAIKDGKHIHTSLSATAPVMVFWVNAYGLQKNDMITIQLLSPNGTELASHDAILDRNKAQFFQFIGKKRPGDAFEAGNYKGNIRITRTGANGENITIVDAVKTLVAE